MRLLQFWVLMLLSCFVCFLYFRQIFLNREIDQEQRVVVDSQEAVSEGQAYENAWNQLARSIYVGGRGDNALLQVLRRESVEVREASGTSTVPPALTPPTPVPAASSKAAPPPAHPATP